MSRHLVVALVAVVMTALGQVLLKLGARRGRPGRPLSIYLNPFTISGYGLMFLVTLLNVYALKVLPLKIFVILLPMIFLLVALVSVLALRERMTKRQVLGSIVILIGIAVYYL